mmetsp:Transcript_31018/g.48610  ORF Transcript_31018/g.48610 Transcript_31018/m.48610 type:complete len:174 (+) Transcript_31018:1-522(+)
MASYGTVAPSEAPQRGSSASRTLVLAASAIFGLMAVAALAAVAASQQATPNHFKSELESYTKLRQVQRLTMLDEELPENADGEDVDQEGDGYECCWHAPNPALASTSVASKVGPNGWGLKPDADGSVPHYENALGAVPDWVFKGTADHEWKSYDDTWNQDWYENTYPSGESGI